MNTSLKDSLSNALLQSMQEIANNVASNSSATLTIEAKIIDIVDEGKRIYKVEYLGNTFEATAANDIIYNIDEMVYITIPDGNFDKNKIIVAPISASDITYASVEEGNSYITLGDNLFASVFDVGLCTYRPHEENVELDLTGFSQLFMSALKDSRTFNFTCRIKTNIEKNRRSKGNYGLILTIPVTQAGNAKTYTVVLDINNLSGDPYNYTEYALQNCYFTIPADMEYDASRTPSIHAFVNGFIGEYSEVAPVDIWIKDISLVSSFVVNSDTMSGYYLSLTATEGTSFLSSRTQDEKTIIATLYLDGKKTNTNGFDCYWFKENCLVDNDSDKFHRLGGLGWEILNDKTDIDIEDGGKETFQYVTNIYQYLITQSSIHFTTRFKCVLVKDNKVVEQIITIKNLANNADIVLTSATGSNAYVENTGRVRLIVRYYEENVTDSFISSVNYAWQRFDKFGNYLDNDFYTIDRLNDKVTIDNKNYYETEISYPTDMVDNLNTIYCTVYLETSKNDKINQVVVGTKTMQVTTTTEAVYTIKVENGDKLYKYDADGDSPVVANYDGPLSSAIKNIAPINVTLFKPDGTEFTADEYSITTIEWMVPINSMISLTTAQKVDPASNPGYYTIKGNYNNYKSLSYNISSSYNKKKTDNTIIIKAYFKDNVAENVANIRFLKDGESGTNGTKYSAIVTYNGAGYGEKDSNGKVNKLQLIYVNDESAWYKYNLVNKELTKINYGESVATLDVDTYADGEKITNSNVTWSIFDNKYTYDNIRCPFVINASGQLILKQIHDEYASWTNPSQNFCATIEAKVRAKKISADDGQTGSEEYIYAYYPIEMTRVSNAEFLYSIIPTLDNGFSQVVYASDGTNPQYDTNNSFAVVNDADNLYDYTWSSSTNLSTRKNADKSCKVTAASKFDNGLSKNFVRVNLSASTGAATRLASLIAELQGVIANENNRLNYYNMLQNALDIFQNFEYNSYINDLQTASAFFTEKTNLVKIDRENINSLRVLLDKINIYFEKDQSAKLTNLRNEVIDRINQFTNLLNLSYKLGTDTSSINQIKAVTPYSLLISNINIEPTDQSYYITLRDSVIKYNNQINVIYTNYYNQLDDVFITLQGLVKVVFDSLSSYVNDSKWNILASPHNGINEQVYLYAGLVQNLHTYINNLSDNENYSYDKVINNILKPIKKVLDQFKNKNYNEIISKINKNIIELESKLNQYNTLKLPTNVDDVIHIQPIIMIYNRYERSNINGWDGNKLVLDNNGRYIVAPQVGAGMKNNDNTFTGIVMGVKQENSGSASGQQIGLFGYSSGLQSIFLNAKDGSATFGVAGTGQIIMDPSNNTAVIKSGNYSTSAGTGLKIDLTTPEIRFGSGNFVVDASGNLTAKGNGSIGGWRIGNTTLTGGNITLNSAGSISGTGWSIGTDGVGHFSNIIITGNGASALSSSGSSMNWGNKFSVGTDGQLTATSVDVSGKITAISGKIGNITIANGAISSQNGNFRVDAAGNLSLGGTVSAAGVQISNGANGYLEFGTGVNVHPTVSGLNVMAAGINMNGHGISNCINIGAGGAVFTFAGASNPTISTGAYFKVAGGAYLKIGEQTISNYVDTKITAHGITGTIKDSSGKDCTFNLRIS